MTPHFGQTASASDFQPALFFHERDCRRLVGACQWNALLNLRAPAADLSLCSSHASLYLTQCLESSIKLGHPRFA
jgi:hypothetical protein